MQKFWKKLTFFSLFIRTFFRKNIKILITGFFTGFITTAILALSYPLYSPIFFPRMEIIGIVGNHNISTLPLSIREQISIGLTSLDADGTAKPALATNWIATDSGKRYIFYLRKNAYWHDGKEILAEDISYNIKGAVITPIDNYTLQIDLPDIFSPLATVLSKPVLREKLIGLGLYKVTNIRYKEDTISLLELSPTKKNLKKRIYKFYHSLDEAVLAFKLGEVNRLENIPSIEAFSGWKSLKIKEAVQHDRFLGLFFNVQKEELKEKETRQGLSFAVPDFEGKERLFTPIAPESWAYFDKVRIYKYELSHAKDVLGQTSLSTKSAQLTISTYPIYLPVAQKIADSWNAIGLKTKVKVERTLPTDYQALLITQEIPADPDQYQYWHSSEKVTNLSHYANLKIDKLLEDGRKTLDIDVREKLYADFQRYLVDDAPVAFLYFPTVYTIERQ